MTPQSSLLPLGQILPAVNSTNSIAQVINESYTEIIQLKTAGRQLKLRGSTNTKAATAATKSNAPVKPKVQVKMRLSKNPNQCPPKLTARKRSTPKAQLNDANAVTNMSAVQSK